VSGAVLFKRLTSAFQIAVSNYARDTIAQFTGVSDRLVVLPTSRHGNLRAMTEPRKADQILFVGFLRRVKGVDLLLKAMRKAIDRKPSLCLVIVGGGFTKVTGGRRKNCGAVIGPVLMPMSSLQE
jgi:glycosyltransferase involved in cell wall biosynthesis